MVSSDTSTRSIRDSTLTAVLMPCLNNGRFVLHNKTADLIKLPPPQNLWVTQPMRGEVSCSFLSLPSSQKRRGRVGACGKPVLWVFQGAVGGVLCRPRRRQLPHARTPPR